MALKDIGIKALKARDHRYEVTDREGLLLEVHPSGRKVWRYRYRLNGKREKLTIGPYPAVGLKRARKLRLEAEELVQQKQSPALLEKRKKEAERRLGGDVSTVADLAERWIANVLRPVNKHAAQDETYVRRDLLPILGALRPDEVSAQDVWRCAEAVLKRGHGQAARRVRSVAKRMFDYALSQGLVRANPAATIRPTHIAPTRTRSRVLKPQEIRQWLTALYTSRLPRAQKLALHFLLLVPSRKGEFIQARQENFDLKAGTWDIPAEHSKNGAPLRHKLPPQALAIVTELHALAVGSPWVLPSSRNLGREHIAKTTLNAALGTVEGAPAGAVIHDLRRTCRTGLAELGGVPEAVAELCLNHRPQGVSGVYDRAERLNERARALQRWADHIDAICAGGSVVNISTASERESRRRR
jgi:integrase